MKTNEYDLLDGKIEIELKDGILNASINGKTGILALLISVVEHRIAKGNNMCLEEWFKQKEDYEKVVDDILSREN